ncbi:unnamed protein product [Chondrus crispus]|uniref:Uncharacterized protein n=1 Tax=Chondrus crispus TaxID=2769 RepID=R7QGK2_CHOCR|nr:unnamed protein product [Chondrus crispus]CDF37647.1 unnamed protein product [Chondrus crispus]|eukprot:XP_005717518.1 unnamed protein product [Chondrus crispus]
MVNQASRALASRIIDAAHKKEAAGWYLTSAPRQGALRRYGAGCTARGSNAVACARALPCGSGRAAALGMACW